MNEELSKYEKQRLKNIEYNKSILQSLEIPNLVSHIVQRKPVVSKGIKRKRNDTVKRKKQSATKCLDISTEKKFNGYLTRSKRSRLASIENGDIIEEPSQTDHDDDEGDLDYRKRKPKFTEKIYGSIPGVPIGTVWTFRMECSHDGVHRPTVAGIHSGPDGCYSVALSGGYEDDIDYGECFTYTGEGGRDLTGTKANPKNLRTAEQSKHQTLSKVLPSGRFEKKFLHESLQTCHKSLAYCTQQKRRFRHRGASDLCLLQGNVALMKSVETRKPVRVVRGYKLNSPYAPAEGYRYDGLYSVEKHWKAVGLKGFHVFKFALKRLPGQAPPPWLADLQENSTGTDESPADTENVSANANEVHSSGTDENPEPSD